MIIVEFIKFNEPIELIFLALERMPLITYLCY